MLRRQRPCHGRQCMQRPQCISVKKSDYVHRTWERGPVEDCSCIGSTSVAASPFSSCSRPQASGLRWTRPSTTFRLSQHVPSQKKAIAEQHPLIPTPWLSLQDWSNSIRHFIADASDRSDRWYQCVVVYFGNGRSWMRACAWTRLCSHVPWDPYCGHVCACVCVFTNTRVNRA